MMSNMSNNNPYQDYQYHQQQQQPQAQVIAPIQVPSNLYMPQDANNTAMCNNNATALPSSPISNATSSMMQQTHVTTANNTSNNLTMMDPGRNHVLSPPSRSSSLEATMDKFLSMPVATQDSYLQEFFQTNVGGDVTPLSPQQQQQHNAYGTSSNNTNNGPAPSTAQRRQSQEDHPILLEFADLWENVTSAENAPFHPV
jgi:hypothetical protein